MPWRRELLLWFLMGMMVRARVLFLTIPHGFSLWHPVGSTDSLGAQSVVVEKVSRELGLIHLSQRKTYTPLSASLMLPLTQKARKMQGSTSFLKHFARKSSTRGRNSRQSQWRSDSVVKGIEGIDHLQQSYSGPRKSKSLLHLLLQFHLGVQIQAQGISQAPGVNILAAYPPMNSLTGLERHKQHSDFTFISGTSMATPHVAGVAAYVKSFHPGWTPAYMTTAKPMSGRVNKDAEFAYDAGHLNPAGALDPSLIYDINKLSYLQFLCHELRLY